MKHCPVCDALYLDEASRCEACGHDFEKDLKVYVAKAYEKPGCAHTITSLCWFEEENDNGLRIVRIPTNEYFRRRADVRNSQLSIITEGILADFDSEFYEAGSQEHNQTIQDINEHIGWERIDPYAPGDPALQNRKTETTTVSGDCIEDKVEHPSHYASGEIECIDAIRVQLGDGFAAYCQGNVCKYLWRWKNKGGLEDLKKARVYLNWMIDSVEDSNAS